MRKTSLVACAAGSTKTGEAGDDLAPLAESRAAFRAARHPATATLATRHEIAAGLAGFFVAASSRSLRAQRSQCREVV
jgi:hypothetical protein